MVCGASGEWRGGRIGEMGGGIGVTFCLQNVMGLWEDLLRR